MSLRHTHVEILLRNYLGSDFQSTLAPLNLMQHICLYSRCGIHDNFITPKSMKSNILSFIGTVVYVLIIILKVFTIDSYQDTRFTNFMIFLTSFDIYFYSFGLFLNFGCIVFQSTNFVSLILKIKEVHEVLNNEEQFKKIKNRNWIAVWFLAIFFFIMNIVLYKTLVDDIKHLRNIISVLGLNILWCFDANIVYAKRALLIIRHKLEIWIKVIQEYTDENLSNNRDEETSLRVLYSYFNLLEAFQLFKKIFNFTVSISLRG